jgi:hypothetical protein
MLNFVENLLENERDPRSGPMNDQDHSLSLSGPDRSLALSHFLTNFLQNLASCHTALKGSSNKKTLYSTPSCVNWAFYGTRGPFVPKNPNLHKNSSNKLLLQLTLNQLQVKKPRFQ